MQSGTILIDGVDIQTVPRNLLRERIITICQDPFILNESVRKNMDPISMMSDDQIICALDKVQLWQLISSRGGLDTHMKEQPLSQGQQQLFSLARAILSSGRILVLDEATSNVDGENDQLMQRVIREEFSGRTIITIAHRIETIEDADLVVVLDAGLVVEIGDPKELLEEDSGSHFRRLYTSGGNNSD